MTNVESYTVLLVEDDSNDVFLIQRAFRKANLPDLLQVVGDGEAAVNYLMGQEPYNDRDRYPLPVLILLDLKLPRKSGHEVIEWLRQQPNLKRLPVVVLTSSSDKGDVNRAYDLGANSYLVKPVAFEALKNMMQTLNLYWLLTNEKPRVSNN